MDLKSYLMLLKANIWVILTTLFVTVAVVTGISFIIPATYSSSTTLRVATDSSGVASYSDYMYADRLMNTYIKLITSSPVLDELSKEMNLESLPAIHVELIPNTELIRVTVNSQNPQIAQTAANSLVKILITQGKDLYSGGEKSVLEILSEQLNQAEEELHTARQNYDTYISGSGADPDRVSSLEAIIQLKEGIYNTILDQYDQARLKEIERTNMISVVEPAVFPVFPSKPNKILNIGLGFILGLTGGIGLAFLFENLYGTRLYTSKQIAAVTGLKLIGKIPHLTRRKLKFKTHSFQFNESFRRLYAQLILQNRNIPNRFNKTFMITSSEPGEGKSTITANLGIAIAQSGKKVIIVDCDLIIPEQHKIFDLPNETGLSTLLDKSKTEGAVRKTQYPGLFVITSGPMLPKSAELLGSPQMTTLMNSLSQQFDVVLLDTPAFLAVADSAQLVPIVDGVVLVVRRNQIREEVVVEATRQLMDIDARIIGLVVNEAERNGTYYYGIN